MIDLIFIVLSQIMFVESGCERIGMHRDGQSYGLFGLTEPACAEVGEKFPPETPRDELRAAKKYLELMAKRYNTEDLWEAAGYYHNYNEELRKSYVALLKADDHGAGYNAFKKIFKPAETNAAAVACEIAGVCECVDPVEGPTKEDISRLENRVLRLADEIKEIKKSRRDN